MSTITKLFLLPTFLISANAAAYSDTIPSRQAGLWTVTSTSSSGPIPSAKHCIDAATDAKLMQQGTQMGESMGMKCSKNETKKSGDKYIVETECNMNGVKFTSTTTVEGDFKTHTKTTIKAKYDPAFMGQTEMDMVMSGVWSGPCQAGQVPGDLIMENGHKMNINNLGKNAPHKKP
jgi:hypothetical protein